MAAARIEVEVARSGPGDLALRFVVTGGIASMPPVTAPARADGLWRHTCFEAFLRPSPGAAYYEFNFAPSTQWAAYRFSGYRNGMKVADDISAPRIDVRSDRDCYELRASLVLDRLPDLADDVVWHLGISAVLEETSGRLSYWALAHPPGEPDFHHSDCFALDLAPA